MATNHYDNGSLTMYGVLGTIAYLTLVRLLRYRNLNRKLDKYFATHTLRKGSNGSSPSDYPMTPAEAQEILRISSASDMPYLVEKSLEFALFKTYGIESISKILLGTGQLTKEVSASKRFVDTALLIATWINVPITGPGSGRPRDAGWEDPRGAIAVARTNWLHSKYKIKNDDYLYTLSLFILEPAVWTRLYGWRSLTPVERQAYFVFWVEIGRRMNIENIPETLEDMQAWCDEYERANMFPSPINQQVAVLTTNLLLYHVPDSVKPFGRHAVAALCPERLRESIMQPTPPAWVQTFIGVVLRLHTVYTRYLSLPRFTESVYVPLQHHDFTKTGVCPAGVAACPFSSEDGESKTVYRLHPGYAQNEPWYMPTPSIFTKLKLRILAAMGLYNMKAMPRPQFMPEGFRTEELGPISSQKNGREVVLANAEALHGGPLSGPWAFSVDVNE
ncbi:hypothetical protein FRC09_009233 [Ceratobasidium sp. 395]|nr:hypothetical protein FRC09_009233 [Ceratobasidium sp. 395]